MMDNPKGNLREPFKNAPYLSS